MKHRMKQYLALLLCLLLCLSLGGPALAMEAEPGTQAPEETEAAAAPATPVEDGAEAAPEETGLLPEETASSEARQAEGEGGVPLDEAHFPDERFRNYIQNLYDSVESNGYKDNYLNAKELGRITYLSFNGNSTETNFTDLTGIEYFSALKSLTYYNTRLSSLDLSGLTTLQKVHVDNGSLAAVKVEGCTALTDLTLYNNQIKELDVSSCTALTALNCAGNPLERLGMAHGDILQTLNVQNCQITDLNLNDYTVLKSLNCGYSAIKILSLRDCTALERLHCSYTEGLTALDLSSCPKLRVLECEECGLTALDLQANPALQELRCSGCALTALDLSANTALTELYAAENQLSGIELSSNPLLKNLGLNYNPIPALDLSANPKLENLSCAGCLLTSLDLRSNPQLNHLGCADNRIETLDVTACPELKSLSCWSNQLKNLDIDNNQKLEILECYDNPLGSLKLSRLPTLVRTVLEGEREEHSYGGGIATYEYSLEIVPEGSYWGTTYSLEIDRSVPIITAGDRLTGTIKIAGDLSADGSSFRLYPASWDSVDLVRAYAEGSLGEALYSAPVEGDSFSLEGVESGSYTVLITKAGKYAPVVKTIEYDGALDLGEIPLWLYGDTDRSGSVDALDVLNLQLYIGSKTGALPQVDEELLSYAMLAADVDNNGQVSALDVLNLQLFVGSKAGTMAKLP